MSTKTDNPAQVGMHVFERSKLGVAPFRCVGVFEKVGPLVISTAGGVTTTAGSPGQPMGVCDHCGASLRDCYQIRSADGRVFIVGSSCVEKTGDAGLIKSYKNSPEVRAFNRAKVEKRNAAKRAELNVMMVEQKATLEAIEIDAYGGKKQSMYAFLERSIPWCGAAGIARNLSWAKTKLAEYNLKQGA